MTPCASLLIWYRSAISSDFGTAGRSERFRVSLGLCSDPSLPVWSLSQAREWEGLTQHSSPPTQCNPFWSPLLFMLYWSKELPNPLPNPPPALTHRHTHPRRHTQTLQTKQNSWNCSDWRGPLRKRGHREWGETTTEKEGGGVKERKKNIYRINFSEFHWLHKLLWSCYTPSPRPAPPPLCCLLPTLETMTVIIEGRENRGGDWERSTGIRERRAYHKWEACTSWYTNTKQNTTGKHYKQKRTEDLRYQILLLSPNLCLS